MVISGVEYDANTDMRLGSRWFEGSRRTGSSGPSHAKCCLTGASQALVGALLRTVTLGVTQLFKVTHRHRVASIQSSRSLAGDHQILITR